jgi:PAS domain S-box-containing protein
MPPLETDGPPAPTDSEARLRVLIDAAPVAMLVVDRNGRIILVNRQAATTFGYAGAELLGRGIDLLVPESSRRLHHLQVESFFHAMMPRVMGASREVLARHSDGREFPIEVGLTPIETADGPQAVAAIVDVTERRRVETESTLARLVQQAMLPQTQPGFEGCDIFGTSKPADATGGDFYDFIPLPGQRLGIAIGDASGHGFAAALLTVAARSYLRAVSSIENSVSEVLAMANKLLVEDVPEGRFVTLFYAVVEPSMSLVKYAGAGHSGYLFNRDGCLKQSLDSTGPALGWFPTAEFPTATVHIEPGDLMLLLTDGIEESMSAEHELFGRQRVFEVVKEHCRESAADIIRALLGAARKFQAQQMDDATAIAVKFNQGR